MPKQYLVFKTTGKKVFYETGDGWSENRGRAVRFSLKKAAETYMNRYIKQTGNSHYGVVDAEVNTQILRTLSEADTKKNPSQRKKNPHKKNPHKKKTKKVQYLIFNWNDYQLAFLHATNQWVSRRVAVRFTTKAQAARIARSAAKTSRDLIGVAPTSMTSAQIITAVKDGCISAMRKKKAKGKV